MLASIDEKLGKLISISHLQQGDQQLRKGSRVLLDVDELLKLPLHLKEAATTVMSRGSATAEDVAQDTGKSRAAESDYLNQLVKMGYLTKKREGRIVYFYVQPEDIHTST
jgi:predicted transcriptional regulator